MNTPTSCTLPTRLRRGHVGSPTWASTPDAFIPTSSLQLGGTARDCIDVVDEFPDNYWLSGRSERFCQNTQIYEGTNQVQRVVVSKHLLN